MRRDDIDQMGARRRFALASGYMCDLQRVLGMAQFVENAPHQQQIAAQLSRGDNRRCNIADMQRAAGHDSLDRVGKDRAQRSPPV